MPSAVLPSKNVTAPVGRPELSLGFGVEVSVMVVVIVEVEVESEVTFCVSVALLPENESEVFWHICGGDGMATSRSDDVVNVARPLSSSGRYRARLSHP